MTETTYPSVQERRARFLAVLEKKAEDQAALNMMTWITITSIAPEEPSCGTSACATGWAMLDDAVADAGLGCVPTTYVGNAGRVWANVAYGKNEIRIEVAKMAEKYGIPLSRIETVPYFDGKKRFDAVEHFLGLSSKMACYCFDPDYYTLDDILDDAVLGDGEATSAPDIDRVLARVRKAFDIERV